MTRSSTHTLSNSPALRNNAFLQELGAVFEPENLFQKMGLIVEARSKNWYLYEDTGYSEEEYSGTNHTATPIAGTRLESELGSLQSISSIDTLRSLPASPVLAFSPLVSGLETSHHQDKPSTIFSKTRTSLQDPFTIGLLTTMGHFLLSTSAICAAEAFRENKVCYALAVLSYLALDDISRGL
ncbi:hypothetical protein MD484_g5663, partial [Candolleomyces efflorescens]